ncbi:MAG: leucine-rich repeat protein, partial [Bacteroidales bacterium]|nr:leucine-rich repeat protein [Bacteroidales bacterium]
MEELTTEVTEDDIKNGVEDEFGIVYSRDGKRLLKCNNHNIKSYEIKKGTLIIGESAFKYCDCLQKIIIPESVTEIGNSAFECVSLQEITIPNSVKSIGDEVFYNCESLMQITLSNSLTTVGAEAFWGCKSLHSVILPDSVKEIGDYAFRGCKSLQQINIPDSVTTVGKNAFYLCSSLQTYIASDLVHRIKENLLSPRSQSIFTKNLKIKKLRLKNFRAFADEEVCFDDFNCIIGKNDVGKSTIFAALEWFFNVEKQLNEKDLNSENDYFIENLTQYGTYSVVSVEVYFSGVHISFEKNNKDVFDKDGCVCIKKQMSYSKSDDEEKIDMKYYIKRNIFKQIRGFLYEEEWQEHRFCKILVNSYKFCFYTSLTSLNDYLNELFQIQYSDYIEDAKSRMAKDLSEIFADNSLSEKIRFKKNKTIDLFTDDNLLLSSGNIPLKNRGEGIQLKIKNAVFKILTGIQTENHNTIFAFEEPETHLHPSAQIEMYETIKKLSENPNYQVFITTHSPYIVKQLAKDNIKPIVVKRDENLKASKI